MSPLLAGSYWHFCVLPGGLGREYSWHRTYFLAHRILKTFPATLALTLSIPRLAANVMAKGMSSIV